MHQDSTRWRGLARAQEGLISRAQLAVLGIDRHAISHRVRTERWQLPASDVVATTTGPLSAKQRRWIAVLHGGDGALLSGVAALEDAGLAHWTRPQAEVLIPYARTVPSGLPGVIYRRTRRNVHQMRDRRSDLPRCRVEHATLLFASAQRSAGTSTGVLAAVVQQRLTTPGLLLECLDSLAPLPRAKRLRETLDDIAGGVQSSGEREVKRMCKQFGFALPRRQTERLDAAGRRRFTDCEWLLSDGRTLVLEVDGAFHMEVDEWEDGMRRGRALAALDRVTIHCSTFELRDEPESVARDLLRLGIPRRL